MLDSRNRPYNATIMRGFFRRFGLSLALFVCAIGFLFAGADKFKGANQFHSLVLFSMSAVLVLMAVSKLRENKKF